MGSELEKKETGGAVAVNGHSAIANLLPQSFNEVLRFGEMLSKSKLVPSHLQGKADEKLCLL